MSRERKRRISNPAPYNRPPKAPSPMPTTRHSPTRPVEGPAASEPSTADVLKELVQLRKSIEGRFAQSSAQVVELKGELLSKLDANDQAVSEVQLAITDVTLSVDQNQRAIHEVRAEVERREVELPQKVKAIVQEALDKSSSFRPPASTRLTGQRPRKSPAGSPPVVDLEDVEAEILAPAANRKDEAYDTARRSLRLWPVSREGDIKDRAVEFLVNELLLEQQHASGLDFRVRRVGARPTGASTSGVKDEVLLTFGSVRERDEVRSHAKNLERRGRGLRLEVPDHLWPSFRVLQNIGYELKQKHAGLKRNVLFDDNARDLKLDVFVDGQWKTISPEGARHALAKLGKAQTTGTVTMSHDDIDDLLSENMETQDQ